MRAFFSSMLQRAGFVPAVQAEAALQQTRLEERRAAQQGQRSLAASLTEHFTSSWQASTGHVNADTAAGLAVVRARSRDAMLNNEHGARFLSMLRTNILGANGIRHQSRVKGAGNRPDDAINGPIEAAYRRWSRRGNCDVTGRHSWRAVERLVLQHLAFDGEMFIRAVKGRGVHRYQVQLLDPVLLDINFRQDLAGGRRIRQGIEMDGEGRVLAYHFNAETSGEAELYSTTAGRVRVPAEQVRHIFLPHQVNQYRGIPWMSPVLKRLWMTADFAQAGLNKARESAKRGGFFQSRDGAEAPPGMIDPATGKPVAGATPVSTTLDGQWDTLPEGYEAKPFDNDWPRVEYGQMVKDCVRQIATGLGVSYNTFGNDLSEVNYSSARVGILDEREVWKLLQQFVVDELHDWNVGQWLPMAMLSDARLAALDHTRVDDYVEAQGWTPRRWAWVDPLKESEAASHDVESRFASPQQVIRDRGDDPDEVLAELFEWQDATAGLAPAVPAAKTAGSDASADDTEAKKGRAAGRRLRLITTTA